MSMNEETLKKKFSEISRASNPKSNMLKHCINAFWVGGLICDVGQFFINTLTNAGLPKEAVTNWVPIIMVFLGALFTGIGVYDELAEFAGAGTVVPITGFANSIVSPAIEFKKEGFIFGVGAKMFTIAGPVLVYGISSSVIIGLIYYIFKI